MRSIAVNSDPATHDFIVSIAAYVRAAINDVHPHTVIRESSRIYGTGESCANDQYGRHGWGFRPLWRRRFLMTHRYRIPGHVPMALKRDEMLNNEAAIRARMRACRCGVDSLRRPDQSIRWRIRCTSASIFTWNGLWWVDQS